ncbi:MAG: XRE family transcriptional regulator, partial [Pseudonocardiaceae bacterium]
IRDLHTSLAAGQNVLELLAMGVELHVQGSHAFLRDMGAPGDLRWQTATLALQFAREHGGSEVQGLATFGAANGLLGAGEFDAAQAELDSVTVPTVTGTAEQLDGMLALSRSLVAAADKRPGDVDAPLEYASQLAMRTGEGDAYGLGFGPTNVGVWRLGVAVEQRSFGKAVSIAEGLHPTLLPSATRQATYWANYGRALARVRGRQEDAVRAFRTAELISPGRVQRNPFVRDVLAELLPRPLPADIRRELRGMAYRAGLPV